MSFSVNVGFDGQRNCCITLVVPGIFVELIVYEIYRLCYLGDNEIQY